MSKLAQLSFHKNLALALLFVAAIGTALGSYFQIVFIKAFCEAALIGGLADWFAVVALFGHPLGLKFIPHTAIIPKNKDKIAQNLGEFIKEEFLTPKRLKEEFDKHDLSLIAANALQNNAQNIASFVKEELPNMIYVVEDKKIRAFIKQSAIDKISALPFGDFAANALTLLTKDGMHKEPIAKIARNLASYLEQNRERIIDLIKINISSSQHSPIETVIPIWSMLPEKMRSDLKAQIVGAISGKCLDEFVGFINENIDHYIYHNNEISETLSQYIGKFAQDLRTDPQMRQKVELIKTAILQNKEVSLYMEKIWDEIKEGILKDLSHQDSKIQNAVCTVCISLAQNLRDNKEIGLKLNAFLKEEGVKRLSQNSEFIGSFITQTVISSVASM